MQKALLNRLFHAGFGLQVSCVQAKYAGLAQQKLIVPMHEVIVIGTQRHSVPKMPEVKEGRAPLLSLLLQRLYSSRRFPAMASTLILGNVLWLV